MQGETAETGTVLRNCIPGTPKTFGKLRERDEPPWSDRRRNENARMQDRPGLVLPKNATTQDRPGPRATTQDRPGLASPGLANKADPRDPRNRRSSVSQSATIGDS
jgi:hypothetical protein